nr:tyrosine-type recombinase/integrase [Cellvibrio sp. NN19]
MAVTGFLERLYYFGIIKSDFFVYFKLPRVNRRLPADVPDEIEMEQVLRQAMTKGKMAVRDRAILEVYYATGVRRTELANLDIKDVDFKYQLVTVRKGKGGLIEGCLSLPEPLIGFGNISKSSVQTFRSWIPEKHYFWARRASEFGLVSSRIWLALVYSDQVSVSPAPATCFAMPQLRPC